MRGTSRSCCGTPGADATANAASPSSLIDGSSAARSALAMMKLPAGNLWPPASNGCSAADILTLACVKRNVTSVLSVVLSTITTGPVPVMLPGTAKSAAASVIGWDRIDLSATAVALTFLSSGIDQPVSSYGRGLSGE